jgi:4-amino-4-deoxy-L-arabinose transferase-like glycosyltransferase
VEVPRLTSQASALAGLLVVVALFCAPLFIRLGGWDLASDEAIYSYAVDRMVETGEWLTPRSIQVDGPFLEKPPLKFWIVAAAIRARLLPHDEFGLRFFDALMGAYAFVYIYLFGRRLAGVVCGVASVLTIYAMQSVLFDHGLRTNNMEAALLLTYCAGMYHFMRWVDGARQPRLHSLAVGLAFVLGFMTKFVAALFLPMVCAVVAIAVPLARRRWRAGWRDWVWPMVAAIVLIAPWFIYETVVFGRYFWQVILGLHVYTRFTGALDPAHLQPWHFYFTRTWDELAGSRFAAGIALAALIVTAWRGHPWQMRLLLIWWLLPLALISLGTSKLFHYAYPFLPPIAIAVGWMAGEIMRAASREWALRWSTHAERMRSSSESKQGWKRYLRSTLVTVAMLLIAITLITAISGPVSWRVGGVRVFQNSALVRPLLIAALLLVLAGRTAVALKVLAAVILVVLLPVSSYRFAALRAATVDDRWRTIRDCAASVAQAHPSAARGVFNAARTHTNHTHYYYLFRLGTWEEPETARPEDVRSRLFNPDQQTLVLMTTTDYDALGPQLRSELPTQPQPAAFLLDQIAIVMPGPYRSCATVARSPR